MSLFSILNHSTNSFHGQEPGEKVILFIRRHPILIIIRIITLLIAFIIPLFISLFFIDFLNSHHLVSMYLFIACSWALLVWVIIFYSFTMYTLDVWIVTDRRIIDSTQHGFFNRTVSELHMARIQDISVKTEGGIQTLLDFGDLFIQTAGTEERFKFLQIPNPVGVKDQLMKMAFPEDYKDK